MCISQTAPLKPAVVCTVCFAERSVNLDSGELGIILYGDTKFNQQSGIISDEDDKTTLTVVGDFENAVIHEGLKSLKATGSITLRNNNQHFEEIHSDTSVNLSNSGLKSVITKVSSGGDIRIGLDVTVGEAHAEGNIHYNSKKDSNLLQARKNVNINSQSQGTVSSVRANESITVNWASKSVVSLQGKRVHIQGKQRKLESVFAEDNIRCSKNLEGIGGTKGLTLTAASFTTCNANNGDNGKNIIKLESTSSTLKEVSSVPLISEPKKPIINAADEANIVSLHCKATSA